VTFFRVNVQTGFATVLCGTACERGAAGELVPDGDGEAMTTAAITVNEKTTARWRILLS